MLSIISRKFNFFLYFWPLCRRLLAVNKNLKLPKTVRPDYRPTNLKKERKNLIYWCSVFLGELWNTFLVISENQDLPSGQISNAFMKKTEIIETSNNWCDAECQSKKSLAPSMLLCLYVISIKLTKLSAFGPTKTKPKKIFG